jgi:hypothetical protein
MMPQVGNQGITGIGKIRIERGIVETRSEGDDRAVMQEARCQLLKTLKTCWKERLEMSQ